MNNFNQEAADVFGVIIKKMYDYLCASLYYLRGGEEGSYDIGDITKEDIINLGDETLVEFVKFVNFIVSEEKKEGE